MRVIKLRVSGPIGTPVTKFGGQPVWLSTPQWPIDREGRKMRFVCQIALPADAREDSLRLAYLFLSDNAEGETWDAEAGDNAVIVQPGPFEPHVPTVREHSGPSLEQMVPDPDGGRLVPVPAEYAADWLEVPDAAAERSEDDSDADEYALCNRVGGPPRWLQNDETPAGGPWTFLAQIDSCTEAYSVNFGDAGIGYLFVATDGRRARFLWQCC